MTAKQLFQKYGLPTNYLKDDLPAGLVVFLVALPLCLGIALASDAPLFSGLIAGIVGGLVVSIFSGSQTSVSGPAAGLVVIVLSAIAELGTFEAFLLSVLLAGVIQYILGLLSAGAIGNYFPSSVIKGMLAAIGLTLIFKQLPHALGYDADYFGDDSFWQANNENTFSAILHALNAIHPGAVIVTVLSMAVLLFWNKVAGRFARIIPGPLVVVMLGILANVAFKAMGSGLYLAADHLVFIPSANSFTEFFSLFTLPDFSRWMDPVVYKVALTLAIVASLESLLNVEAVDKLDPFKRKSSKNQELKAQGIGNMLSGLIGGLPVTAVIVRGAANVNAGGKTKTSPFIHGIFLLAAVVLIPQVINLIPYASLASILLVTGYKLTNIALYRGMFKLGYDQFIPFIVTVVAIMFTDLLVGIIIGLCVGVLFILRRNMRHTYSYSKESHDPKEPIYLVLSEEMSFLNKASVLVTLEELPPNSKVIIDGTKTVYIDYDVLEVIQDFKENSRFRNIQVELRGIENVQVVNSH